MKRTRRIEVIRYSRRVTVVQGGDAPADAAAVNEVPAIDVAADARELILPAHAGEDGGPNASETATHETARRRSAFRLRDLLRLRR